MATRGRKRGNGGPDIRIGRSSGFPTSYSIGAGQEAGLQFLENGIGAKKIIHYGMSLGGGAQAEAILSHEFKTEEIDYIVWTDRSFDKLSNIASSLGQKYGRAGACKRFQFSKR